MKKILSALLFIIVVYNINAQAFLGAHYTTKDAILTNSLNPAMPAASSMKWQVNLFGININAGNNYLGIQSFKGIASNFDKDVNIGEILDGKPKDAHIGLGFNGPAFMIKIKKNNAISIGVRGRGVATINDLNEDLVQSMYHNFKDIFEWAPHFKDDKLTGGANVYHEIYAGYSRTINIKARHALHVGVTGKMITNIFNAQVEAHNVDFNIVHSGMDSFVNVKNSQFDFLVSDRMDDGFKYKFGIDGVGFDVGLIYELKRKETDEPLLLAGFSVNDIGFNSYNLGKNSRTFIGNNTNIPASHILNADGSTIEFDMLLDSLGTKTIPTGKKKMKLPMTLNTFVDVRIAKMFYANANFQFNPYDFKKGEPKANMPTNITITPRFETRIFSAYLPVTWNKYSGFNAGLAFRIGQVTLGSSNVITSFIKKPTSKLDFYMNISFGKMAKAGKIKEDKPKKDKSSNNKTEENRDDTPSRETTN
ncbi:MAG TPA: DUF5723 family protein [Chitinophagales bacterium]|nr:DUF5723 family protein [Chitinophagales bacterium]HNK89737.1 DUF5723 family protein [Chitinophagales bacterium]